MSRVSQKAQDPKPPTRPCFPTFTILGIIGLGILVAVPLLRNHGGNGSPPPAAAVAESDAAQPAAEEVANQSAVADAATPATAATQPQAATSRGRLDANPITAGPGFATAQELIGQLTRLPIADGKLTPDQGRQIQQSLHELIVQGAAAVPAIAEFLRQNQEVNFGAIGATGVLGGSSLRSAFINALGQIGGPEATSALLGTLQSTTLPSEIAQLAQVLDQQAPGQYRQETVAAVNEVLNMASTGQLPAGWDVGTLFKVLQNYGDSGTASALEQLQGPYRYYATMSLAGLQGGQGVPALVSEVQNTSSGSQANFAYQMLAQVAGQSPDASAALLQQAKANQIPDSAWSKIATGLAGDQYQIGAPPFADGLNADAQPGLKTYHIASGNQNFYSLPLTGDAQVQQNLAVIDQLLGVTSSPAAVTALQSARATLTGATPH